MPRCHFTAVINEMTNQVSVLKKQAKHSRTSRVARGTKGAMVKANKCADALSVHIEIIDNKGK